MLNRFKNIKLHKKTVILALLLVLVLLLLFFAVRLLVLSNKISFEYVDEEVPEIDPAYAAGQGIVFPSIEPVYRDDIVNILFLGTDFQLSEEERGRCDSNMLCSLNTRTGDIKLVSFERGIGVPVPGRGSDLLTHAYHWGGSALSQSIISSMFSVDVKGYVQVDFDSFAAIISVLGGVDVELTEVEAQALNGAIPTQVWAWAEVHEGWNHLGGHDTLQYCRLRSIDSDWNRQRRQRTVLEQVQKKCRGMSPTKLLNLAEEILPMIHTNLSKDEVTRLILKLPVLLRGEVTQLQVPDKNGFEGTIRCIPDYEAKKIANFLYDTDYELITPY